MRIGRVGALVFAVLAGFGCGRDSGSSQPAESPQLAGVRAIFDPTLGPKRGNAAATWLAFPYPSDHRRLASGHPRFADFPNPSQVGLLQGYIAVAEARIDGFGTNSAVHVAFDGALDLASFPADAAASMRPDSPVVLVDVTKASPEYGRRFPLRWEYRDVPGRYAVENSLAVAPAWGFPLREKTTYALVMTDAVRGRDGNPLRAPALLEALLRGDASPPAVKPAVEQSLHEVMLAQYAPLRTWLTDAGIATERVALATVFTTQDITGELAAIHRQVTTELAAPAYNDAWRVPLGGSSGPAWTTRSFEWKTGTWTDFYVMEGVFDSWSYQEGVLPYAWSGGALHFVDGKPEPVRVEPLRFVLTIPKAAPLAGGCYPIVEVAHGTGGDAYSFFRDGTAGRLAARGLAGVGLDQPLHGERAQGKRFDVEAMSFNYLNAESSRANFRQSAIDTFVLTRFVRESLKVPAAKSPTGKDLCFDAGKVGFFGHSHGGLSGAMAAAYERRVGAWMLSGAGGGISITAMDRKDIVNVRDAVSAILQLDASEPLTELHPVMTLIQTLVDATDPINYSPYWFELPTYGGAKNLMATSGEHDQATPYRTATAMAVAARLPQVAPVVVDAPAYGLAGMAPVAAPVSGNVLGKTAGFLQWTDDVVGPEFDTHFLVFHRPEAIHAAMRFLQTGVEGAAVIERDPNVDAR